MAQNSIVEDASGDYGGFSQYMGGYEENYSDIGGMTITDGHTDSMALSLENRFPPIQAPNKPKISLDRSPGRAGIAKKMLNSGTVRAAGGLLGTDYQGGTLKQPFVQPQFVDNSQRLVTGQKSWANIPFAPGHVSTSPKPGGTFGKPFFPGEADGFDFESADEYVPQPVRPSTQEHSQTNITTMAQTPQDSHSLSQTKIDDSISSFDLGLKSSIQDTCRRFSAEVGSATKAYLTSSANWVDIGSFSDSLNADLTRTIEFGSALGSIIDSHIVARDVEIAIDEHTRPVSVSLVEASTRNATAAGRHVSELRKVLIEIDSACNVFGTNVGNVIDTLMKEHDQTTALSESTGATMRQLQQRMVSVRARRSELEARISRHEADYARIAKIRDRLSNVHDQESPTVLQTISEVSKKIASEKFKDITDAVDQAMDIFSEERDNLREEVSAATSRPIVMPTPVIPRHQPQIAPESRAVWRSAQSKMEMFRERRRAITRDATS